MAKGISPFILDDCKKCQIRFRCPLSIWTKEYSYKKLSYSFQKFENMLIGEQLTRLDDALSEPFPYDSEFNIGRCMTTETKKADIYVDPVKLCKPFFDMFFKRPFIIHTSPFCNSFS